MSVLPSMKHHEEGSSVESQKDNQKQLIKKALDKIRNDRALKINQGSLTFNNNKRDETFEKKCMLEKWKHQSPFYFFLTSVKQDLKFKILDPADTSISYTDLFDTSFGTVAVLFQMTYVVELKWLLEQMCSVNLTSILVNLYIDKDANDLHEGPYKDASNVIVHNIESCYPFGHHHTKMGIIKYTDDSIRFIITTANLVEHDWDSRTNGVWISPKCPKLTNENESLHTKGESVTYFKRDVLAYLRSYKESVMSGLFYLVQASDCSEIKVVFVASVPTLAERNGSGFGTRKMETILKTLPVYSQPDWALNLQCSSIGALGSFQADYFINEVTNSMAGLDQQIMGRISVIFPTVENVKDSLDGIPGGLCLPYHKSTHDRQKWIKRYFCKWQADSIGRSQCLPHIKSYCRLSPDYKLMSWYLLTSANLSKSAWGVEIQNQNKLRIMSWEAGIMFLPFYLCGTEYFSVDPKLNSTYPIFPLTYDIPPVGYNTDDEPFTYDALKKHLHII